MWWLAALLVLLCFSALDIVVKSAVSSGNQSASAAQSSYAPTFSL
jgi:hypothetical protein